MQVNFQIDTLIWWMIKQWWLISHPSFSSMAVQLTWSLLQEELAHCEETPMQKQRKQPSGLASDRWKNPGLHSSQTSPATLFCSIHTKKKPRACTYGIHLHGMPIIPFRINCDTLQLHGLLLELIVPLLSQVELAAGRAHWKDDVGIEVHLGVLQLRCIPEQWLSTMVTQLWQSLHWVRSSSLSYYMHSYCSFTHVCQLGIKTRLTVWNTSSIRLEGVTLVTSGTPEM